MENLLSFVRENLDTEFLNEHVLKLFRIARKQTFPAYHQEAQYACDLLKQEGFDAEILHFPADASPVSSITRRSTPGAAPAWGGAP